MATYAIGDVHGCYRTLRKLLETVAYAPPKDRLWQVGDLVNRGPASLDVLRWAMDQGEGLISILGNHELHLLSQALGVPGLRERPALAPILHAPDAAELIDWVKERPLVHTEGDWLMTHAGILPQCRQINDACYRSAPDFQRSAWHREQILQTIE